MAVTTTSQLLFSFGRVGAWALALDHRQHQHEGVPQSILLRPFNFEKPGMKKERHRVNLPKIYNLLLAALGRDPEKRNNAQKYLPRPNSGMLEFRYPGYNTLSFGCIRIRYPMHKGIFFLRSGSGAV